ncbi:MAG: copper resistance protein CopC [Armatimonadota bacterium]|nr:copper resistance protein CopC [Armatimonadota bacterium]
MKRVRRLLLACLLVATTAGPALAHAVLQTSTPAHGASLDTPPAEVVLTFTEPVHPQASSAQVVDAAGRVVSEGFEVVPDGRTVRVKVGRLDRGTYTVRWKVLSRLDGHVTEGRVSFGVGVAPAPAPLASQGPPWWQVFLRWLGYLAALSLAGALAFQHLVLSGAAPDRAAEVRRVVRVSASALAAAALADTLARSVWLQSPGQGTWATLWTLVRTSQEGPSLLLRVGAAVLALDAARTGSPWTAGLAGGAALLGITVTSHAWAVGPLAAAVDWLHLAAASVWVGGLACVAVLLSAARPRDSTAPILRAFSRWAGYSLAVVAATGAYAVVLHVPSWDALAATGYGRWLVAKILLVAVLVGLGALNRYRLLPRLEVARGTLRRLRLSVRAEVAVASLVLLAAGAIAVTPPARTVQAAGKQPLVLAALADSTRVLLTVDPGEPGWNRFLLAVRDARGNPVPVDRVVLRLRKLDEEGSVPAVVLEPRPDGSYIAEGTQLGLAGFWELEVVLRVRGRPDRTVWFPLRSGSFQLRSDLEAFRFLRRAQEALERLRTWRETEQITDGAGNVVVTRYTYQRPDRLAFEVVGGMRGVLIGKDRFVRTDRGWQRDTLPEAFTARGPALYMQNPLRAALGRQEPCPDDPTEPCQAVLWDSPDGLASFGAWVGTRTHRVHRLLMWAPAHAMTSVLEDFDAPARVEAPGR